MSEIGKQIRRLKKEAASLHIALATELTQFEQLRMELHQDIDRIRMEAAERVINGTDVDALAAEAKGVRFAALKTAGYQTIGDIRGKSEAALTQVKGIGPEGAAKLKDAVARYTWRIAQDTPVRIDASHKTPAYSALVKHLYAFRYTEANAAQARRLEADYESSYKGWIDYYEKSTSFVSRIFSFGRSKVPESDIASFIERVRTNYIAPAPSILENFKLVKRADERTAWSDFEKNVVAYYNLIDAVVPSTMQPKSEQTQLHGKSGISEDLVEKISALELDTSLMESTLRRYQSFGTKYILHQKRTLLGDEMGLGKTIQAIAAIAHLKSQGKSRFIVVCPLSVLVNWAREIEKHSMLSAIAIHGSDRTEEYNEWYNGDAVAVTTYETLDKLPFASSGAVDMLVVDEAHNVKNPDAKRTKHVLDLIAVSEYVLYMTGTPLENRVEEMRFLLGSVNPETGRGLKKVTNYQENEFKTTIAGTYLRRVREDVLKELPELIDIEDWMILNDEEKKAYRQSLFSEKQNFMAVRRVSWNVEIPEKCGKLNKLKEICEDAKEEGRKVIVFSYFRDTLEKIAAALGEDCTGIIHGGVKTEERQKMIDVFAEAGDGAVLVAQIEAGGVGLNIQAASVVILCEPQFKPSTENQAISRAYRMGQARGVTVHRLLMKDTIDEKMRKLVIEKGELFEAFAQHSYAGEQDLKINESAYLNDMIEEERKKYSEPAAASDVPEQTENTTEDIPAPAESMARQESDTLDSSETE